MTNDDDSFLTFPGTGGPVKLSPEGEQRRVAMRLALEAAVVSRRRRRLAGRAAAFAVLLAAGAFAFLRTEGPSGPPPRGGGAPPEGPLLVLAHVRIEMVATDASVLERCAVPTRAGIASAARVGDDDLLDLLSKAGHETGLARFEGRVVLTNPARDDTAERVPIGGLRVEGS